MTSSGQWLESAIAELPAPPFARAASILFTISVWTYLLSVAASQTSLALAAICYAVHLLREKPAIQSPPAALPMLLFCSLTVLSVATASAPNPGWLAVRKLVLFLILLLTTNLVVSAKHLEMILKGLFLESGAASLLGVVQFISNYQSIRATHPHQVYEVMSYAGRIQGFMGHWMNFSGEQMLVLASLLAFVILGPARRKLWWLLLAIIAASVALSLTRGVWIGCFLAAIYILACWKPRWLLAIPILLAIAYLGAPSLIRHRIQMVAHPGADPALAIRLEMWEVGLRMIRTHPWLGVGPDDIDRDYALYLSRGQVPIIGYHSHLHNNLLEIAADRGLLAFAAWVWFMGALGWQIFRLSRRLNRYRWIAQAGMACWISFVAEGCFEFNFGTSPVLMLFLFVVTLPFIADRLEAPYST